MPVYTFRITYEDDESLIRDIQVKPSQTVNELNRAIVAAYKIKSDYNPSLFISNDGWKKVTPLNGVAMDKANTLPPEKETIKGKGKSKAPKKKKEEKPVASPAKPPDKSLKLFDIINDPHQKLIAEYEAGSSYSFHIELLGIDVTEDKSKTYPLCSKSVGPSPFQNDDLRKYLDSRAKGEDGEEYALDKEEDDTDGMGVETETEAGETSEDTPVDPEIADEFGSSEGFEDMASDE
jgi:hypothetical protein